MDAHDGSMTTPVAPLAEKLRRRNEIDAEVAAILGRPMTSGHAGEWIAAQILGVDLEASAVSAGHDGAFGEGLLAGRTVNVKWYLKREGLLDMVAAKHAPDFYLVLTGPAGAAVSSRGAVRPWVISNIYLFETATLTAEQERRGVKTGTGSSVTNASWVAAEIYPRHHDTLPLSPEQRRQVGLFAPPSVST